MVYDWTELAPYIHIGEGWEKIGFEGNGGGGGGHWIEDNSPMGIYYSEGNVGVGTQPLAGWRYYQRTDTTNYIGSYLYNEYNGGLTKFGIYNVITADGTGERRGHYSKVVAPSSSANTYAVYAEGTANSSASDIYGIYSKANGTGTGEMYAVYGEVFAAGAFGIYGKSNNSAGYAGFFEGDLRVGSSAGPSSKFVFDPDGHAFGRRITHVRR